jgi:hypothetical protein
VALRGGARPDAHCEQRGRRKKPLDRSGYWRLHDPGFGADPGASRTVEDLAAPRHADGEPLNLIGVAGAAADRGGGQRWAVLAISRLCAPDSVLAVEERWYPSRALDDLLGYRGRQDQRHAAIPMPGPDLPHKTPLEQHLKQRYGELFGADFQCVALRSNEHLCGGAAETR